MHRMLELELSRVSDVDEMKASTPAPVTGTRIGIDSPWRLRPTSSTRLIPKARHATVVTGFPVR